MREPLRPEHVFPFDPWRTRGFPKALPSPPGKNAGLGLGQHHRDTKGPGPSRQALPEGAGWQESRRQGWGGARSQTACCRRSPRPCPAPPPHHLPAPARQHRDGAARRGLPPPHPQPLPLSPHRCSPRRSRAPRAAEERQRSESPGQRELHSEDLGSASPATCAEEDESSSMPAISEHRQDPGGPPPASGPRAGQGEAAGLAGGSAAAGLGPFLPWGCQRRPGGDARGIGTLAGVSLRAGQRAQGRGESPSLPLPPAPAYSSPRSCSSSVAAATASRCQLADEEKEALDCFLAFLHSTSRVTGDFVSSEVLPSLLPARGLLEGCWLCRAAPLPAPAAIPSLSSTIPASLEPLLLLAVLLPPHPPSLSLFSLAVRKRPRSRGFWPPSARSAEPGCRAGTGRVPRQHMRC